MMTKQKRQAALWQGVLLVAAVLAVLLVALPVMAQGGGEEDTPPVREVSADEVNEISSKLYCPVCENIPLDVCATEACSRWREQVRTLLEDGATEDEVVDYFVEQFGQRVVGTPQDPMLNFFSWAVPIGGVVLGVVVVGYFLIRWSGGTETVRRVSRSAAPATSDEDADYRARLEAELRMLE